MRTKNSNKQCRSRIAQRLLEIYRSPSYRTTVSGRRVQWDEPGEDDSQEIRRHNEYLAQQRQRKTRAQDRLKRKGIVPSKNGQPMFEDGVFQYEPFLSPPTASEMPSDSRPLINFRDWLRKAEAIRNRLNREQGL